MIAYAICGSFCNHKAAVEQLEALLDLGYDILPVLSEVSSSKDTRFGSHIELVEKVEALCRRKAVTNIVEAENISGRLAVECIVVSPCTGNTLAKIALGVTDGAVPMAVKAHLRNNKNVLVALATNDGLGGSFQNIAALYNKKHVFFVPLRQDAPIKKPNSLVCDFRLIPEALSAALEGKQLQPFFK